MDLKHLNEMQRKAVTTTEGPVMCMAGAGSGKTSVLTHRIAYLIEEYGIRPSSILAVTFTNKAAREMKERVEKLTGIDTKKMWVSTFHSFCARLLRIEIDGFLGYTNKFVIIDEEDSIKIIKNIMKSYNIDSKEYKPKYIKGLISDEKNLEILKFANPELERIYNLIKEKYNEELIRDNLLDFDDLILITVKLFKSRPEILEKYQNKFNYIMVDEFQDTNTIQYLLVKMLAIRHHNIFIVGDQDQSIYSFRGAKVENIDIFQKDFLQTQIILLEENYRSTNPILAAANRVIDNNKNRIKKNLFTRNTSTELPYYNQYSSSYDEVISIINKIKFYVSLGYEYNDFAILYRANSLSRSLEDMFTRHQIPYVIYGGLSFYERKEIKDMLAYIRLIVDQKDNFSFKRIVNEPKRKIGQALIDKLEIVCLEQNMSLFEAIDYIKASGQGYTNLLSFKFMILELREKLEDSEFHLMELIDQILDKTGYYNMLKAEGEEGETRLDNVKELKSILKEIAEEQENKSKLEVLEEWLSDIALRTDSDNKEEAEKSVKMMTYHQAKGLEYRVVFMIALEQGIFPSQNCYTPKELEEERRICYVGITRAKEKLYLSSTQSRYLYGQQISPRESCYIEEIGYENLNTDKIKKRDIPAIRTNRETKVEVKQTSNLSVGDKINHKAFGDGKIVAKDGQVITVAFASPYGIKKLIENHPSIRKL